MLTERRVKLILNRQLTADETALIATESLEYELPSSGTPQLHCMVEEGEEFQVIAAVVTNVWSYPKLRVARIDHGDTVTLLEAADRTNGQRTSQSLYLYASGQRGGGKFPAPVEASKGTSLYSWVAIAEYLRGIGCNLPPSPSTTHKLIVADRLLRLMDAVATEEDGNMPQDLCAFARTYFSA